MRGITIICILCLWACNAEVYEIKVFGLSSKHSLSIVYDGSAYNLGNFETVRFNQAIYLSKLSIPQQPANHICSASTSLNDIRIICLSTVKDVWQNNADPALLQASYSWFEYGTQENLWTPPRVCEPQDHQCLHLGIRREIALPGIQTCQDLHIREARDTFVWACIHQQQTVKLVSLAFKKGRGLLDLLNADQLSWRENSVEIFQSGQLVAQLPSSVWWNNSITEYFADTQIESNTIYIIKNNPGKSLSINTDHVALVVLPETQLSGDQSQTSVLNLSGSGLWIEGKIDSSLHRNGIVLAGSRLNRLHQVTVVNSMGTNAACIKLQNAHNNWLEDISIQSSDYYGIDFDSSQWNHINALTIANSQISGLHLFNSQHNVFNFVNISNSSIGIQLERLSNNNLLNSITSTANDNAGVALNGVNSNMVVNLSTANNGVGLLVEYSSNNHLRHVLAFNNNLGINIIRSNGNTLSNLSLLHNGNGNTAGLIIDNGMDNYFTGHLYVAGDQGNHCQSIPFLGTGITDNCAHTGSSDFWGPISVATDVFSPLPLDEQNNLHAAQTTLQPSLISDWIHFDNPFRAWSKASGQLAQQRGRCRLDNQLCQIRDWRLTHNDVWNRANLPLRTGHDYLDFDWQADENTCHLIAGAQWDGENCSSRYLRNATELSSDGVGNDNLLCESGEHCLFTGNIGSYQGHGNIVATPYFQGSDTGLQSIVLFAHINNGI